MTPFSTSYQPDRLIALLYAQYPQRPDVRRALQLCADGSWSDDHYIRFIGTDNADEHENSAYMITERLVLVDEQSGTIVIHVVADGRIAGIEFVRKTG